MEFDDDEAFDLACIKAAELAERCVPGLPVASAQAASTPGPAPASAPAAAAATGPRCEHGLPSVQRRVIKSGPNYQRTFWACTMPQGQTCRWIGWADNAAAGSPALPQGGLEQPLLADSGIDPCYRCDGVMRQKTFGNGNFYGCANYPWCRVLRSTARQTAILELVASRDDDVAAAEAAEGSRASSSEGAQVGGDSSGGASVAGGAPSFVLTLRTVSLSEEERSAVAAEVVAALNLDRDTLVNGSSSSSSSGGDVGASSGRIARLPLATGLSRLPPLTSVAKRHGWYLRAPPPRALDWLRRAEASLPPSAPGPGVEAALFRVPAALRNTLLPFQREGVAFGLQRGGRCLIADEMGTGKTLQAMAIAACYVEDWPLLVVVPASMRISWACEVERWFPSLAPADVHVVLGSADRLDKELAAARPRVTIISFHMLNRLKDTLGRWRWDTVVVDESHQLTTRRGSSECQQVQVCLALIRRAKHAVLLSGTPSLSKPFDLFSQVDAIQPGLLGKDKYEFAATYCEVSRVRKRGASGGGNMANDGGGGGWGDSGGREPRGVIVLGGAAYPEELHALLCASVMIRRLKADVVAQLPTLRRTIVRMRPDAGPLNAAKRCRAAAAAAAAGHVNVNDGVGGDGSDLEAEGEEAGELHAATAAAAAAASAAAKARAGRVAAISASFAAAAVAAANGPLSEPHEAGLLKVASGAEWLLDKLLASDETETKFVVYAHHTDVLDALQERLETSTRWPSHYAALLRIDGSTGAADRHDRVGRFGTEAARRVLLVSVTAGGQGLDLSAASVAVFVELPPRVFWLRQAEDRLHRRGQRRAVNVYYLVLPPGSHDDQRWLSMGQCLDNVSAVVNSNIRQEHISVNTIAAAGDLDDYALSTPERRARPPIHSSLGTAEKSSGCSGGRGGRGSAGDSASRNRGCSDITAIDIVDEDGAVSTGGGPAAGRGLPAASPSAAMAAWSPARAATVSRSRREASTTPAPSPATLPASYKPCGGDRRGEASEFGSPGTPMDADAGNARDEIDDADDEAEASGRSLMAKGALLRAVQSPSMRLLTQSPAAAAKTARTRRGGSARESGAGKRLGFSDAPTVAAASAMLAESSCMAEQQQQQQQQQEPVAGGNDDDGNGCGCNSSSAASGGDGAVGGAAGGSDNENEEDAMPDDLYFEVSRHTGRIHLHKSEDGLGHLGASFDAENFYRLLGSGSGGDGGKSDMAGGGGYEGNEEAGRSEGGGGGGSGGSGGGGDGGGEGGEVTVMKGPASAAAAAMAAACRIRASGLLDSLPRRLQEEHGALALAAAFLEEYRVLKPRQRNILHGQPARPPLAAAVAAIEARKRSEAAATTASATVAAEAGDGAGSSAFGVGGSRRRYTPISELFESEEVIDGAEGAVESAAGGPDAAAAAAATSARRRTREIVLYLRNGTARRYHQRLAAGLQATPLCLICPKLACDSGPGGGLAAQSLRDLMCSKECYERYGAKTSGRSLRAIVRRRDRGVCDACNRDTAHLVEALKVMTRPEDRVKRALASDPRWGQRPKLLARLVKQPVEGRAWEADHVVGVAEGGGECTADNVRTLCVLCHAENSARQAGERAADRRRVAGAKRTVKASSHSSSSDSDSEGGGGDPGAAATASPPTSLSSDDFEKPQRRHKKRQKPTSPQPGSCSSVQVSLPGTADFRRFRLSQQAAALDEEIQRLAPSSSGGGSSRAGGCSSGAAAAAAAAASVSAATASSGPLQPGVDAAVDLSTSDGEDADAAGGQGSKAGALFRYTRVSTAPPWRCAAGLTAGVASQKRRGSKSRKRARALAAADVTSAASSGESDAE